MFSVTKSQLEQRKKYGRNAPPHPLHGAYEVEELVKNGQPVPPLVTDTQRWRQVFVGGYGERAYLSIRLMDNKARGFHMVDDPAKKTLTLTNFKVDRQKFVLDYTRPDPAQLTLEGRLGDGSIRVRLRKIDESKFLLTSRGFHWINEIPFNR